MLLHLRLWNIRRRTQISVLIYAYGAINLNSSSGKIDLAGATIRADGGLNTAVGGTGGTGGLINMLSNDTMTLAGSTLSSMGGSARDGTGGSGTLINLVTMGDLIQIDASTVLTVSGGSNSGNGSLSGRWSGRPCSTPSTPVTSP